jgi:hypothetical protein
MEEQVSTQSVTGQSSSSGSASRRPLVIVLAVIGILIVIVAIMYFFAGGALPHFANSKPYSGHHWVRGLVSLVVGVAFLAGSWLVGRKK